MSSGTDAHMTSVRGTSKRLRDFGARSLIEDNSVRSEATTTSNGRIGFKISSSLRVKLAGVNRLDSQGSVIGYFYQSRLESEGPDGQNDIHIRSNPDCSISALWRRSEGAISAMGRKRTLHG